ncbi:hypothetical protein J2S43_002524 [Catenuloplanes nepalensis]|uniref:Uncharacterized protein n=1 Tax=Catenuloplanes nepalensis TaxID=587533 RepID=A0ABT9MRG0_9ACTN|nr:hypothetical protein [Catenuloplanes nepalensis]MDP9794012.1 hypothetical protein [Catenuloplanes nepalensis]
MQSSTETDVLDDVTEAPETVTPPPALIMLEPADDAAVCDVDGVCA